MLVSFVGGFARADCAAAGAKTSFHKPRLGRREQQQEEKRVEAREKVPLCLAIEAVTSALP